jgi:hypothetical protein
LSWGGARKGPERKALAGLNLKPSLLEKRVFAQSRHFISSRDPDLSSLRLSWGGARKSLERAALAGLNLKPSLLGKRIFAQSRHFISSRDPDL